jgi:hypothetical protein
VFFIDRQGWKEDAKCGGKHEGQRRATCAMCRAVQQLTELGATVQPWLDVGVDCVVAAAAAAPASARSPSTPSTPTGTGSASVRGISMRAQLILNSKSVMGAGAQASPAQFAEKHGKEVVSAHGLLKMLAAAEWQRDRYRACDDKKRPRSQDADEGKCCAPSQRLCSLWRAGTPAMRSLPSSATTASAARTGAHSRWGVLIRTPTTTHPNAPV